MPIDSSGNVLGYSGLIDFTCTGLIQQINLAGCVLNYSAIYSIRSTRGIVREARRVLQSCSSLSSLNSGIMINDSSRAFEIYKCTFSI